MYQQLILHYDTSYLVVNTLVAFPLVGKQIGPGDCYSVNEDIDDGYYVSISCIPNTLTPMWMGWCIVKDLWVS